MEQNPKGPRRRRPGPIYWLACALVFTSLTGMAGCPPPDTGPGYEDRDGGGDGGGGGGGY